MDFRDKLINDLIYHSAPAPLHPNAPPFQNATMLKSNVPFSLFSCPFALTLFFFLFLKHAPLHPSTWAGTGKLLYLNVFTSRATDIHSYTHPHNLLFTLGSFIHLLLLTWSSSAYQLVSHTWSILCLFVLCSGTLPLWRVIRTAVCWSVTCFAATLRPKPLPRRSMRCAPRSVSLQHGCVKRNWIQRSCSASLPNWRSGHLWFCNEKFRCSPKSIFLIGCHHKRDVSKTVDRSRQTVNELNYDSFYSECFIHGGFVFAKLYVSGEKLF